MKVIFLDIDGVLNVMYPERDEYGSIFHPHLVDNLKMIIDATGAKLVISSSWRHSGEIIMKEMWKFRNLPGEVIGITPWFIDDEPRDEKLSFKEEAERGREIDAYMKDHPEITNYVIIDDDDDTLPSQESNFVKTSENHDHEDKVDYGYGLTKKCSELAIAILNR
jgi:hypothetical protein